MKDLKQIEMKDMWPGIYDLRGLVKLAEKIKKK